MHHALQLERVSARLIGEWFTERKGWVVPDRLSTVGFGNRNSTRFALNMLRKKIDISFGAFILFLLVVAGINISCDGQQGKGIPSEANLVPVITSITISPDQPNKENELSLFIQTHNPGGNPLTYRYQWIKNDDEISGEETETLKSANFKKGDLIRVKIIPSDGKAIGKPFLSDPIKILNMPPVVEEVTIEPKLAYAKSGLKAVVKSSDSDGDSVNYHYTWEKNGVVLSENETSILESNGFQRGDSVTVTVTPDDGEASGKPMKSEALIIANSPPIVISSPATNVKGDIYTYHVKAEDPDNDPLTFALKTAPKGMVINKETGFIQWEVARENQGNQLIEIDIFDPEGAKSFQKYTLLIEFR